MNNKNMKTEFYMEDLEKQTKIIMNIYNEILKAGGCHFSRDRILSMSLEEFIYNCTRNNLEFNIEFKSLGVKK